MSERARLKVIKPDPDSRTVIAKVWVTLPQRSVRAEMSKIFFMACVVFGVIDCSTA